MNIIKIGRMTTMTNKRIAALVLTVFLLVSAGARTAFAADPIPNINIDIGSGGGAAGSSSPVSLILLLTVLSLSPSILILMTSFTRIVIVLGFVRTSLGTQQMPPNQVLIGLALFLTFFYHVTGAGRDQPECPAALHERQDHPDGGVGKKSGGADKEVYVDPYAFEGSQTVSGLLQSARSQRAGGCADHNACAAYAISELKTAFQMGFMIFIPFLVIDMVISSTLMAMGMMMLPPVMISLPFKILLFCPGGRLVFGSKVPASQL